jgi:hypothetical protein
VVAVAVAVAEVAEVAEVAVVAKALIQMNYDFIPTTRIKIYRASDLFSKQKRSTAEKTRMHFFVLIL